MESSEYWIGGGNHIADKGIHFESMYATGNVRTVYIFGYSPKKGDILYQHRKGGMVGVWKFKEVYDPSKRKKPLIQRIKRALHPMPPPEIDYTDVLAGEVVFIGEKEL